MDLDLKNNTNSDILEILKNNNLKLYSSILNKENIYQDLDDSNNIDINSSENINIDEKNYVSLRVFPEYHNNPGFFTVICENSISILLKGMKSDFHRSIRGKAPIDDIDWSEIAETAYKAEHVINKPIILDLILIDGISYIKDANISDDILLKYDMRDFTIPRPLANNEYSEQKSKMYDEEIILSSGYFGSMLPQVSSYYTSYIFENLLDLLNPIFTSCNLKTTSPTIMPLFGRIYTNISGLEKIFITMGLNKSLFRRIYSPQLFLKMKNNKLQKINRKFFPIKIDEIEELLEHLKNVTTNLFEKDILEKIFFDYIVQFSLIYVYLSVEYTNNISRLLKYFDNISDILNAIYKTRDTSIFYNKENISLPEFLDFASPFHQVVFGMDKKVDKFKIHLRKISFFKSKRKAKKIIKEIHKLLDIRDEVYLTLSSFIQKVQTYLYTLGDFGVSKNILYNKEDIFSLDFDEVKRLSINSFYGETKEIIKFRNWRNFRYKAAIVPNEVYGYDLSEIPFIVEDMFNRFNNSETLPIYPLNNISIEGVTENNLDLQDYDNKILTAYNLSIPLLNKYKNAKGFIIENINPFSFVTEYAILNNIGLYTGIRYAPLFLKNISINNNILKQI